METKFIKIPFEIELAKRIQNGEAKGRIVTRDGRSVRVICWDRKDKDYPIVCLVCNDSEENIENYTTQGAWDIDISCKVKNYDLMLEVPEYVTFKDGAIWRINSVWHDNSEKPVENKLALVKYITGDGEMKFRVDVFCGYEWKEMCHYDSIVSYAYIEDLLPIKGDEK